MDQSNVNRSNQMEKSWTKKGVNAELKFKIINNNFLFILAISSSVWHFSRYQMIKMIQPHYEVLFQLWINSSNQIMKKEEENSSNG